MRIMEGESDWSSKNSKKERRTHLDVTSLGRDQRHDHLHNLDLSVDLSGVEVVSRLDEELDDLSGTGRSELSAENREVEGRGEEVSSERPRPAKRNLNSRIVLLLDQTGLGVDLNPESSNLLSPVESVRSSVEKNEHSSVGKRSNSDDSLSSVDVESVDVRLGSGSGEVVSDAIVDEVEGEDGLEGILGRDLERGRSERSEKVASWDWRERTNLSLAENPSVLSPAGFGSDVRLDDGSADDGEVDVGSFRGELVG